MGGFVSCVPDEDEAILRSTAQPHQHPASPSSLTTHPHHQTAVGPHRGQMRAVLVQSPPMANQQRQHQHHILITPIPTAVSTPMTNEPVTRVLRERLSSPLDSYTYTTSHGVDYHANARICMEATPNGKDKAVFKFYCPICFLHYKEIYKSACCSNYICVPCALAHITQRLNLPQTVARIPSGPLAQVCCPSCNTENVSFTQVLLDTQRGERPRNYVESPHTKDCLAEIETRKQKLVFTTPDGAADDESDKENKQPNSRVNSFQGLHQKILNFESVDENHAPEHSVSHAALPPRRPHTIVLQTPNGTAHHPHQSHLISSTDNVLPPTTPDAPIPSIASFSDSLQAHPLTRHGDDGALPEPILPAPDSDDLLLDLPIIDDALLHVLPDMVGTHA